MFQSNLGIERGEFQVHGHGAKPKYCPGVISRARTETAALVPGLRTILVPGPTDDADVGSGMAFTEIPSLQLVRSV